MFLIDDLLMMPARGIMAVFREVHNAAQQDAANEAEAIRNELSELYMRLETQQLSEEDFDAREKVLLDRLDELEKRRSEEAKDSRTQEDSDEDEDEDFEDEDFEDEDFEDEDFEDEDFEDEDFEDEDEEDGDEEDGDEEDGDEEDGDEEDGDEEDGAGDDLVDGALSRAALGFPADSQALVKPVVEPGAFLD
jgi:hypothetical protein